MTPHCAFALPTLSRPVDNSEVVSRIAERWCDAWETAAASMDLPRLDRGYWELGQKWIAAERVASRPGW
jgi:hypothetical protein